MDSASLQFIVCGLIVALISAASQARAWRDGVLLLASLGLIGLLVRDASPRVLLPGAAFLLLGYAGVKLVERAPKRLTAAVLCVIGCYIWLKKYTFLPERCFLPFPYFVLGLSYIFFRVLSLVVRASNREPLPGIGPLSYLLYLLNFSTFVSGPIQDYDD